MEEFKGENKDLAISEDLMQIFKRHYPEKDLKIHN